MLKKKSNRLLTFTVSIGQAFGKDLAGQFWPKVSHEVAVIHQLGLQSSEGWAEDIQLRGGSFTGLANHCWLPSENSVPLHVAA